MRCEDSGRGPRRRCRFRSRCVDSGIMHAAKAPRVSAPRPGLHHESTPEHRLHAASFAHRGFRDGLRGAGRDGSERRAEAARQVRRQARRQAARGQLRWRQRQRTDADEGRVAAMSCRAGSPEAGNRRGGGNTEEAGQRPRRDRPRKQSARRRPAECRRQQAGRGRRLQCAPASQGQAGCRLSGRGTGVQRAYRQARRRRQGLHEELSGPQVFRGRGWLPSYSSCSAMAAPSSGGR